MFTIYDLRYEMEFGCGYDKWRLKGKCIEHPAANEVGEICPSSPVKLNEEEKVFETASGSKYKIGSWQGNFEKIMQQLREDILKGGYERH